MIFKRELLQRYLGSKRKRKKQNYVNTVEENAAIKRMRVQEVINQSVELMDHISELPDSVIHHILSLLRSPKDAARSSILSKRWRDLWYSFSILIFDERKFARGIDQKDYRTKIKIFKDNVYNLLELHLKRNLGLQKLVLHMISFDSKLASDIDHWLSVASEQGIKELDLRTGVKKGKRYTLPQAVFLSKTLSVLRLSGCKLESCNSIKLPYLRKLHLRKIHLDEHIIQSLISNCALIEDLRLIQCSGLKILLVSNLLQLHRAEIHHCNQLNKVELSVPNLLTFCYCGKKSTPCKVNLVSCKSLKSLTLDHPRVTHDFCKNQLTSFPVLEKLNLSISSNLRHITISNPQLQRLTLKGCQKLNFSVVRSPNLVSFEYDGRKMPSIDIVPFGLKDAKIILEPKSAPQVTDDDQTWHSALREFIKKFDHTKELKLIVRSRKNIVIHENLGEILLPPFRDLSVEIIKSSVCLDDMLNSLLRTWQPETLSILSPFDSIFPMQVYDKIKNKEDDPRCCGHNSSNNKCWRHFLKDFQFEDFGTTIHKRTSDWLDWLKSSSPPLQYSMTNFRLYWNSLQL
ncbi:hypothetical protein L6164_004307 [Bauhinia variegata]|uniref:Uncharacterized protein n=1 Tax=Bauhinia variegata TaxID=167791 RepID=A0ACB9Q6R3_BAUVA|nr:hypothetical protein L6164_004307 [Bauhinia variegata]